ncbi:DUF374 domain-containing protein [Leptospira langatensis]|uniref:DUF374 domain-containing protein n=1 Tax=Leptospira langatensis TaxID=2484983 RepID=A0A5F1ZVT9_9LEPT|nr:lysophospholipid acyltransferase family protein [Leptospira langatensis]TGK01172.1 DUF374 domain-containing protein [Leptospira langatensis]TGL42376.1 DUF374 domain-containing protein [Leptospira langatensis]
MNIRFRAWIATQFLRLIYLTIRWEKIDLPESSKQYLDQEKGMLLALWHNQIPNIIDFTYKFFILKCKKTVIPMASQSKDGELVTRVIANFGMIPKRGSSRKGGATALKALIQDARNGNVSLITPDGPTGPVYQLKPGIIQLASMTGYPILSYYGKYDRYWIIPSWDHTFLPKPFSKVTFFISEPFYVPKLKGEEEIEIWRKKFEAFMLAQIGLTEQEAENVRKEVREATEAKRKDREDRK